MRTPGTSPDAAAASKAASSEWRVALGALRTATTNLWKGDWRGSVAFHLMMTDPVFGAMIDTMSPHAAAVS